MQTAFSAAVVILCVAAFVFFCLRGVPPLIVGLCCTLVVSFVTEEGFRESFFTVLPESIGSSIPSIFFLFLLSSILGELYSATGFAARMGTALTARVPRWFVPFILVILSALFSLGGIPRREFIIAAVAYPVLRAADLPLYLGLVCDMGAATVILWGPTGLPGLPNLLAASAFGVTDLSYAENLSWPATIFGLALLCLYILFLVRRADRRGEGYAENSTCLYSMAQAEQEHDPDRRVPPLWLTFVPLALVLGVCIALSSLLDWDGTSAAVTAQIVAILFLVLAGRPYLAAGKKLTASIATAAERICPIIFTVGMVAAFAVIVSHTSAYQAVMGGLFQLNAPPYVLVIVIVALLGLLTSDGISSLLILQEADIAGALLAAGGKAPALATLSRLTSTAFGTMPWSAAGIVPMQIYGIVNKTGFVKTLMVTVVIPFLMSLLVLGLSFLLY